MVTAMINSGSAIMNAGLPASMLAKTCTPKSTKSLEKMWPRFEVKYTLLRTK